MKQIYVHLLDSDAPVKVEVPDQTANTIVHKLEDARFDFVKFGSLVLPKSNIEKVKITEVGK